MAYSKQTKKIMTIVVITFVLVQLVFGGLVALLFHIKTSDPIHDVVVPQIWDSDEFFADYGQVKRITSKKEEQVRNDTTALGIYTVYTEEYKLTLHVNLEKDEKWEITSMEIKDVAEIEEVTENDN